MAHPTPASNDPTGGYRNAPTGPPTPPAAPGSAPSEGTVFQDPLVVDTGALVNAAALFQAAAGQAATRIAAARARTEGAELGATAWGGDPLGAAFGEQYTPTQQAMDRALNAFAALLGDIGGRLTSAAQLYGGAEDTAADLASTFRRGLS
jgi:uncharacterized protein YukE